MDQQLFVFITVAEKKNFSRAAEELHMTQPAVSQYIQALEKTKNTKLLERTNKYVRLTKAGEIVYHHAKEILGLYTKMDYLLDDLTNNPSGSLSIGASYTYGEYVLPHLLAKMQLKYPAINPSIKIGNTREIAELVLGHQLDVGIVEGNFEDKNLKVEPVAVDDMSIVVSSNHPLANSNREISLSELANETWIIRERGSGTREAIDSMFSRYKMTPKRKLEFGSTQIIKEAVEANLGISLLSDWAIRKELSLGTLTIIKIDGVSIRRDFSTVLCSPFQTKALSVFLKMIKENC